MAPTVRKEVNQLSAQEVSDLRDGYGKMMGISDNRGWIYWCGVHGYNQYKCWHHSRVGFLNQTYPYNLFLPWHRAYLLNFEHAAKDQNANVALPWWDWTSDESQAQGIPPAYTEILPGGSANVLASGPKPAMSGDPSTQTERAPGTPDQLPTADDMEALMKITSFEELTQKLEDIHDNVHGWVGGHMGVVATAAFDPLFWAHHVMIDRIWYLWQLAQGVDNIPQNYLNLPLDFSLKVSDVLDIGNLGYDYATSAVSVAAS